MKHKQEINNRYTRKNPETVVGFSDPVTLSVHVLASIEFNTQHCTSSLSQGFKLTFKRAFEHNT